MHTKMKWKSRAALPAALIASLLGACGGAPDDLGGSSEDGSKATDSGKGTGSQDGSASAGGSSGSGGGGDATDAQGEVTTLIGVTPIEGGGENSAPLQPGCGPETATECTAPGGGCSSDALLEGQVKILSAGSECFFGEGYELPQATVEHITEINQGEEYVHLRVIFDPDFVDTTYGQCSAETGWNPKRPHSLADLYKSDHVELMLYDCADALAMHFKVDFVEAGMDTSCGYATAGVSGGDGSMFVGDAADVLAVATSLDRNMNGCGYCEETESPCPGEVGTWQPSPVSPEWDFRMVYELWIKAEAFGDAGFCRSDIDYVHASPAKSSSDTILVEPDDCPPPADPPSDQPPGDDPPKDGPPGTGECPGDYQLFLTSEGEFWCAGPPDEDGNCLAGYEIDLTSEGELCIPAGP